jgi:hypothetical protein
MQPLALKNSDEMTDVAVSRVLRGDMCVSYACGFRHLGRCVASLDFGWMYSCNSGL